MPLFHILILAVIQGLTEFLPVSSSGHLVLTHAALGHTDTDHNLLLDIAVHVGTLGAVMLYFRADIYKILIGVIKPKSASGGRKLLLMIIISSLPVVVAGFGLHLIDPAWVRSIEITAWATLIFGIILWISDRTKKQDRVIADFTIKDAVIIGLSQMLALIPGTSRSGITMTAARTLGVSRVEAAHYSMLLGMVAISGAGILGSIRLVKLDNFQALGPDICLAILLSFGAAYLAISFMMKWLTKFSFTVFAIYRIILGFVLLAFLYMPQV